MDFVRLLVGVILPYVAVVIFFGGMLYRIRTWLKMPSPAMTLFPAPPTKEANLLNTAQEALFFKSLFKGDRALWVFAWIFHAVLALICIGHVRVFINADRILMALGMSEEGIHAMSSGVGGAAGVVIFTAAILLLVRRMAVARVREITGASDYLILLLIAAIIMTGNLMRFGSEHLDLSLTRGYFAGLATFSSGTGTPALQNGLFVLHMGLAFVMLICLPFSKILHLGGIFFTHHLIRK